MNEPVEEQPRPSWSTAHVAKATVTVIAVLGTAWLFVTLTRFFMLVFAAIVLAVIFDTLARGLVRATGLQRPLALAISIILLLAFFLGGFVLFGAQLAREFDTIRESIPRAITSVEALLDRVGVGDSARNVLAKSTSDASKLMSQAGGYALAGISGLADFVLVFVGAIFMASDPGVYRRGLILLMPAKAEKTTEAALDDSWHGLHGWMVGQAVSSLVVAAFTWAGLALLGVPASGGLGLIAGLLDVIPLIGPIIAGVPAVLLAFTVSPATALWTVGLFLLIQQLQGNLLQPMIQKRAVDVPPALLLFAVVAAGILFGTLGVLLAAPLTVVVFVIVQRVYVRTLLDKPIKVAGEH